MRGIEKEDDSTLYGKDGIPESKIPFNPAEVDIISRVMVVSNVVDMLEDGCIDLGPDYQRHEGLWTVRQQSRLIESLIISIPLPSFYFDSVSWDRYAVVDGIQRLHAIKSFMVDKTLKLTGLEYLSELEGLAYEELPGAVRRRIRQSELMVYVIRQGTPASVRTSIFTRINTGGLELTEPEIRNSVYRGQAAELLRELAASEEFKQATRRRIKPERMEDCAFVNRFLAFYVLGVKAYNGNLEAYLDKVLLKLQEASSQELDYCRRAFLVSMFRCHEIFDKLAFRKRMINGGYGKINKPLFECISVLFASLSNEDYVVLKSRKDIWMQKYEQLFSDEVFLLSITNGTAKKSAVDNRYSRLKGALHEVLGR